MLDEQGTRINLYTILLVIVFVIFLGRLFGIQVLSGDVYRSRAQDISRRTYTIPTQRGEIYDRHYKEPLVINKDTFAVNITPAEVPRGSMDEVISSTAKILNITADEIRARLPNQYLQLYQPVEIASNVPFSVISALAERKNLLPGITWNIKSMRNYVDVGSLSHLLGYVGDITRDELTTLYNKGYKQGDVIGKLGIEKQYDELLKGEQGYESRTVDVRGRRIAGSESVIRVPPEMGKNLILTIDAELQKLAEKAIGQRIGTAVVMKPATGEILAMVSYPWYDPNIFTEGVSADYRILVDDPAKPFINRAIQSSYPPASTFKVIMSTAIYAENIVSPDHVTTCRGVINYGGRPWHCHERRWGHGRLSLRGALCESCNIYYMTVGRDNVGAERIVKYATDYGYGGLTNIDLPGEIAGFVPTPLWKERRLHEKWVLGDTMNMSIGQGFTLVTPLQMCNMVSMVVNNGKIYKPHVLKEVRDPATKAIEKVIVPELLHQSDISPSVFENVRNDMRSVITMGTAQLLSSRVIPVQIAGKTGTAQIGLDDRWHLWFTSFAPYNSSKPDDKIAVTVIFESSTYQEASPAIAAAIIYQGYFAKQTYEEAIRSLGFRHGI